MPIHRKITHLRNYICTSYLWHIIQYAQVNIRYIIGSCYIVSFILVFKLHHFQGYFLAVLTWFYYGLGGIFEYDFSSESWRLKTYVPPWIFIIFPLIRLSAIVLWALWSTRLNVCWDIFIDFAASFWLKPIWSVNRIASKPSIDSSASSGLPGLPLGLNWLIRGSCLTILYLRGLPRRILPMFTSF